VDDRVRRALAITPESSAAERTIDITTTGARTGQPRRIEIWFYRAEGTVYLSTTPARRSWYANLLANPRFTVHLKHGVRADLAATALPVTDPERRRRIFGHFVDDLNHPRHAGYVSQPQDVEDWLTGSPLVEVVFDDP
jgi:deazaflavin-dependent oxidoreductase (nitroreductase family)